jgi:hypothetical protein
MWRRELHDTWAWNANREGCRCSPVASHFFHHSYASRRHKGTISACHKTNTHDVPLTTETADGVRVTVCLPLRLFLERKDIFLFNSALMSALLCCTTMTDRISKQQEFKTWKLPTSRLPFRHFQNCDWGTLQIMDTSTKVTRRYSNLNLQTLKNGLTL